MYFEFSYTQKTRARRMGCYVSRFVDTAFITRLFEETKTCIYCGITLTHYGENPMTNGVLDHIKPLKLGGSHTRGNLQVLDSKCNLLKRALTETVFLKRYFFPELPEGTNYKKGILYIPITTPRGM